MGKKKFHGDEIHPPDGGHTEKKNVGYPFLFHSRRLMDGLSFVKSM